MRSFFSVIQKLTELNNKKKSDLGKIFMFHQITNASLNTLSHNLCLQKNNFIKFIDILNKTGKIKSIDQLNCQGGKEDFYLTFDDIYANAYENALLWLSKKKIPFTVFITLEYLDKKQYISIRQLRDLVKNKYCTIGSHTMSHPILRFQKVEEIEYEMMFSKEQLESICGNSIDYLAYPYGSKFACSKRVIQTAQKLGYKKAFSTYNMGIGKTYFRNNQFFIPRINVNNLFIQNGDII